MAYPERIVPDETEPGIVAMHLKRYAFALPWCEGKDVLDVACGVGYGASCLASVARRAVGGGVDEASVAYAGKRYSGDNIEFEVLDAAHLPFGDKSFDAVCSFETIEHLPDRDAYLAEVARVLRVDGAYLVSTPRADVTTHAPANPFDHVEYSHADFEQLLLAHFGEVELYGQRRLETRRHELARRLDVFGLRRRLKLLQRASVLTGTASTADATLDDVVIEREGIEQATELYAVCTSPRR